MTAADSSAAAADAARISARKHLVHAAKLGETVVTHFLAGFAVPAVAAALSRLVIQALVIELVGMREVVTLAVVP